MENKKYRIGAVYLDTGSVKDWFMARATGQREKSLARKKAKIAKIEMKKQIIRKLNPLGFADITIQWSQKAGCRCGCSPGYIIKAGVNTRKKDLFEDYWFITRYNGEKACIEFWLDKKGKVTQTQINKNMRYALDLKHPS